MFLSLDLKKCFVVAEYTFKEVLKSKVLLNVFFLGIGLMVVTFVGSEFTYGVPEKVAIDFGLGSLSLSSIVIAILMGVGLISQEIENRTIYMVLSRPITRTTFLIGRCAGLIGVLILNILILGIMSISFSLFLGGQFSPLIPWVLLFSILEAMIILLVVICFSLITNSTMTVIYSFAIYVLGHAISENQLAMFAKKSPMLGHLLQGYGFVFPNFSKLNIKDFILYEQSLDPNFLSFALAYGLLYIVVLIVVSCFIFNNKSLD
jgi:ABC-2 type transport system permease protein